MGRIRILGKAGKISYALSHTSPLGLLQLSSPWNCLLLPRLLPLRSSEETSLSFVILSKNGLRPMLPIVIRYRHHNWFKKSYIGPLLHYYTVQCCLPRFGFAGRESILLCCELWDILVSTILGGIFKNIYVHMTEQSTNTLSQLPCTALIFSWWARYLERHGY